MVWSVSRIFRYYQVLLDRGYNMNASAMPLIKVSWGEGRGGQMRGGVGLQGRLFGGGGCFSLQS